MKLNATLTIVLFLFFTASLQAQIITLVADSSEVTSLLPKIKKQSELDIRISPGAFEGAKKVSFNVVNKALAQIARGCP